MEAERIFIDFSVRKLRQLSERIEDCLDRLTAEQVWTRGSDAENAVGNLVLHLCGNVRQWIGVGAGNLPNVRDRDAEFAARGGVDPAELKRRIHDVVEEAAGIIEELAAERLTDRTRIQAFDVSVLEAIYHVVEHFAMHAGQIILLTKAFTATRLDFYKDVGKDSHSLKTP